MMREAREATFGELDTYGSRIMSRSVDSSDEGELTTVTEAGSLQCQPHPGAHGVIGA